MLDLMIPPIAAALIILSIHAYLGLHVIAREVIFISRSLKSQRLELLWPS